MRRAIPLTLALLASLSCASNDTTGDGPESATIRTIDPASDTTSPSAGSSTDSTETDSTETDSAEPDSTEQSTTSPTTGDTTTTPPDSTTAVATTAPTTTVAVTAPPQVGTPNVTTELVASFDQPIDLAVRPGDDALWIVEQGGRIVRHAGDATVALDVAGRVSGGNEQGLLGLAFSPDGGRAYTNHTDTDGTTVITEWAVGADGTFDPESERTVLTVDQPFANHNAGDLAFGPDGLLYVPLGDGGAGGDPERNGSRPTTLLGSLLRIDPTPSGDLGYTVPDDNPFVGGPFDGIEGAPEVWSWGLRNPWKIDFDPVDGRLWIADVGQNEFEEVDAVAPADGRTAGFAVDFGWSAYEGNERFDDGVAESSRNEFPVLTYDHGDGCSISGGVVYRGDAIAELEPAYLYSDFCTSTIWALDLAGGRNLTLVEGLDQVTAVRRGPDGEAYVVQRSGDVLRLVPG